MLQVFSFNSTKKSIKKRDIFLVENQGKKKKMLPSNILFPLKSISYHVVSYKVNYLNIFHCFFLFKGLYKCNIINFFLILDPPPPFNDIVINDKKLFWYLQFFFFCLQWYTYMVIHFLFAYFNNSYKEKSLKYQYYKWNNFISKK